MNKYDIKFRKKTIEYINKGHTYRQTSEHYGIATSTLVKWMKILRDTGKLTDIKPKEWFRKIDPLKLQEYLTDHPDAYQTEIAEHFNCEQQSVSEALKRCGYTRKKR